MVKIPPTIRVRTPKAKTKMWVCAGDVFVERNVSIFLEKRRKFEVYYELYIVRGIMLIFNKGPFYANS